MDEAAGEGNQPEESEEDRDCADYLGVDEALLVPVTDVSDGVKVFTGDADYDSCKYELE